MQWRNLRVLLLVFVANRHLPVQLRTLLLAHGVAVIRLFDLTRRTLGASVSIASIVVRAAIVILVGVATIRVGVYDQSIRKTKEQGVR